MHRGALTRAEFESTLTAAGLVDMRSARPTAFTSTRLPPSSVPRSPPTSAARRLRCGRAASLRRRRTAAASTRRRPRPTAAAREVGSTGSAGWDDFTRLQLKATLVQPSGQPHAQALAHVHPSAGSVTSAGRRRALQAPHRRSELVEVGVSQAVDVGAAGSLGRDQPFLAQRAQMV